MSIMSETTRRDAQAPDPHRIVTRGDFARELTLLREHAGLTVRDVARTAGIPVGTVGDYFAGRHLPPPRPTGLPAILHACRVTHPNDVAAWLEALRRVRRSPGRRSATAPVPYRGLAAFQAEDAEWFFGREELTGVLVERVRSGGGLVAVVGPSGSGKSSLLRAGLVPALDVPSPLFTPGPDPLGGLAGALAADGGLPRAEIAARLREAPGQAGGLLDERAAPVMVVDQFEEVFTANPSEAERRAFITALAAVGATGRASVVIGLRADFYARALRYDLLAEVLQTAQIVVGPMSESELRKVIAAPAHKAGLRLEEGLVDLVLRDLDPSGTAGAPYEAGALPLLSHALLTTWQRRHQGRLTIADYRACGGITGAVARSAEEVYRSLAPAEQRIARQLFIRLVHIADDTGDTRRRAGRSELVPDGRSPSVLDRFIEQRLITADRDTVEIAHEALLPAWPRLRAWLDEDRGWLRAHRRLTIAAEAWRDSDREPGALLRGVRLSEAEEWTGDPRRLADLNDLEREFLAAGRGNREAEALAVRRRTRRRRRLIALATALILLIATSAFVINTRLRDTAARQRDQAVSRQLALQGRELRETDPAMAAQLALIAYRTAPTSEARSALLEAYAEPAVTRILGLRGVMQAAAIAPGGRTLATGGTDHSVHLWNVADRARPAALGRPLSGHSDTVYGLAFSPNGRLLASGSGNGGRQALILWRLGGGPPAGIPLPGPGSTVYSVAFSPDGRTLAAGAADNTVRLWDVANPDRPTVLTGPLTGPSGYVQTVAFSSDGRTLAAGSADRTVRLWDMTDRGHPKPAPRPLTGPANTVFSVAFSPDGRTLAAGSADRTVRLWRLDDPMRPTSLGAPLTGAQGWVNSVAFSPDGRTIAAASSDGQAWVWDLAGRTVVQRLPHPGPVTSVTFSGPDSLVTSAADGAARLWDLSVPRIRAPGRDVFSITFAARGRTMAVVDADATASLWDLRDPRRPAPLSPVIRNAIRSGRASGAGAIDPGATTLAIGGVDGSTQLWDVRTPSKPVPLPTRLTGPTMVVQGITFSPDGHLVAVASNDRTVRLWDVTDPRHPVRFSTPLKGATNYAYQPAFSNDGRMLAYGSADNKVYLWDVSDPDRPKPLSAPLEKHTAYALAVAFSPDGRTLASGGADNRVQLWDLRDRNRPRPYTSALTGPSNYVYSLAYDHAGTRLAVAAGDGTVWLWDVRDPRHPRVLATLTGASKPLYIDGFAASGSLLVSAGAGRTVQAWETNPDLVARYLCSIAGTPITRAEWGTYVPHQKYNPPCS
jgi:WD40 repeat protein/transcriptional regulator with XRE-family HTH domain